MTDVATFDSTDGKKKTRKVLSDAEKAFIAGLDTQTDYLKFSIPDEHPDSKVKHEPLQKDTELEVGQVEVEFSYPVCVDSEEATGVINAKGWNLVDIVNEILTANARSNRYQLTAAKYKPSKLTQEEAMENIIRDMVRQGLSEEFARNSVTAMFAAAKS